MKRIPWKRVGRALAWAFVAFCVVAALFGAWIKDFGLASWYLLNALIAERQLKPPRVTVTVAVPKGWEVDVNP